MSELEKGITAFNTQNYPQALSLLKPLAEEGNAEAQCILATIYHLGLGVQSNSIKAIKWYKKSAEQGYSIAANNLAGIYLTGTADIAANQEEADKWFQKARQQGFLHTPISPDYLNQTNIT